MSVKHAVDASCIFCKIISGTIPCFKLLETEHVLAFLDVNPLSAGHALVIPKHHAQKVHEVPDESMAAIGPALARVARAIGCTDYNILQNNGAAAHQAVFHVHFHIIPHFDDAGLGIQWNARTADKAQLAELADKIKSRI